MVEENLHRIALDGLDQGNDQGADLKVNLEDTGLVAVVNRVLGVNQEVGVGLAVDPRVVNVVHEVRIKNESVAHGAKTKNESVIEIIDAVKIRTAVVTPQWTKMLICLSSKRSQASKMAYDLQFFIKNFLSNDTFSHVIHIFLSNEMFVQPIALYNYSHMHQFMSFIRHAYFDVPLLRPSDQSYRTRMQFLFSSLLSFLYPSFI